MTKSLFWYDFETTGIDPSRDRPMQVAGVRTDEALNEIGEPLNLYCRLSDDIIPHPKACVVTGIRPQQLEAQGLSEAEFMARLHAELSVPGTCSTGYNSVRFDDEVTRYSLYRNFFDPYAREWQGGNSRWDLIDVVRAAYALRPEGIVWPEEDGRVTMRLEKLTAANGIGHEQAHDALSDVRATLALARLIREKQPKLFDWCYQARHKEQVRNLLQVLGEPLVHVSGRFSAARHFVSLVLPLALHPTNKNAVIVCNLNADISPLLTLSAEELLKRLYTRYDDLAEGEAPVPLKLIHINRSPVVAPLKVLRPQDAERVAIDVEHCLKNAETLRQCVEVWREKLTTVYNRRDFSERNTDPERQLYDGFIGERDRNLCTRIREAEPARLVEWQNHFTDPRLEGLLFRYRARNFPETLSLEEQQAWWLFCQRRLMEPDLGAPITRELFLNELLLLRSGLNSEQNGLLNEWWAYIEKRWSRLRALSVG